MVVKDPERLGQVTLPGGRRLAWAEWGPESGAPVLFFGGAATSRWMGFGGDVVDALGVRLVALDRPGLGASDPLPGRSFDDWAQDVRALVAARSLQGPAVVGFSVGAPFALACAAAGIVRGAAVVSGGDELAHPDLEDSLAPELRRLVRSVVDDPDGAEAFFRGFDSADAMWELIVAMTGEVDRAVYSEPGFARAFRRALTEGFAQGPGGYARDNVLAMGRWPFDLARISVPVDLWYGALDTSPVHSPDFGATLARRIASARRRVVPDAGGALLWTHAREIVGALLERTRREA